MKHTICVLLMATVATVLAINPAEGSDETTYDTSIGTFSFRVLVAEEGVLSLRDLSPAQMASALRERISQNDIKIIVEVTEDAVILRTPLEPFVEKNGGDVLRGQRAAEITLRSNVMILLAGTGRTNVQGTVRCLETSCDENYAMARVTKETTVTILAAGQ